jgi:hypothetical protein
MGAVVRDGYRAHAANCCRELLMMSLVLSGCGGGSPTASQTPSGRTEPTTIGATQISGSVPGAALVQALRAGGLMLWMRHTERDTRSGTVIPEQAASHDCAAQSMLTATGASTPSRSHGTTRIAAAHRCGAHWTAVPYRGNRTAVKHRSTE